MLENKPPSPSAFLFKNPTLPFFLKKIFFASLSSKLRLFYISEYPFVNPIIYSSTYIVFLFLIYQLSFALFLKSISLPQSFSQPPSLQYPTSSPTIPSQSSTVPGILPSPLILIHNLPAPPKQPPLKP